MVIKKNVHQEPAQKSVSDFSPYMYIYFLQKFKSELVSWYTQLTNYGNVTTNYRNVNHGS